MRKSIEKLGKVVAGSLIAASSLADPASSKKIVEFPKPKKEILQTLKPHIKPTPKNSSIFPHTPFGEEKNYAIENFQFIEDAKAEVFGFNKYYSDKINLTDIFNSNEDLVKMSTEEIAYKVVDYYNKEVGVDRQEFYELVRNYRKKIRQLRSVSYTYTDEYEVTGKIVQYNAVVKKELKKGKSVSEIPGATEYYEIIEYLYDFVRDENGRSLEDKNLSNKVIGKVGDINITRKIFEAVVYFDKAMQLAHTLEYNQTKKQKV